MATKKTEEKVVAKDKEHLKKLIEDTIKEKGVNCNLNFIDVSNITDLHWLFHSSEFNGDISKWNVSNVTNMYGMFAYSQFNGDISKWDVSNVTHMWDMFSGSKFNGDISKWDVSKVKYMQCMFSKSQFNGDISKWDVSNVTDMSQMFEASQFNGDISKWDVSKVECMPDMFSGSKFNGDISKWNVSNVTDMNSMFFNSAFNNDISKWDVHNVKNMHDMFADSAFDGDISKWNVANVQNMDDMFYSSIFTGDINNWNVSKVKQMKRMFQNSALEEAQTLPSWYSKDKKKGQKPSAKKSKNMFMLNTITMSDAQIKKFNKLYKKNIPEVFGNNDTELNNILSGNSFFETKQIPPIEVYKDMAEKGLEFNIHWEGTEFTELESWGVGNGNAKGGNFWYCIDFNETRAKFLEDYDQDWNPQSSEFVKHMDEYGNNCEIKKFQVVVHGDSQQKIFALPVKKLLEPNKSTEKGLVIFKIPYYLEGNYDSAGRSCKDFSDNLRCTSKDSKKELYLLDKKGQKIKSILDFDHSEPDKNGDVYYPVPASDFEKKSKNKTLTQEAIAKWKKLLGMK